MKNLILLYLAFASYFVQIPASTAQETPDTSLVIIETTDGNQYIGVIVSQTEESILLRTETIGEVTLRKSSVKSIKPVKKSELKKGEYWFENPYATTRYFYNPSGYGLPAGQGYYQNTWILMNQVSVGITDNVSIGVGVLPTFLFALGEEDVVVPIWITQKFLFLSKKTR